MALKITQLRKGLYDLKITRAIQLFVLLMALTLPSYRLAQETFVQIGADINGEAEPVSK